MVGKNCGQRMENGVKNKKRRKQFPSEASKLHAKNTRQKLSAGRDREREKEREWGRKIERERGR